MVCRYEELDAVKLSQKFNSQNQLEKSDNAASTASLQELDVAAVDTQKKETSGQESASISTPPKILGMGLKKFVLYYKLYLKNILPW